MTQAEGLSKQLVDITTQEDDEIFLSELRTFLVDQSLNLVSLSRELDDTTFGALYMLSVVVNDVWVNLAIDASFEFKSDDPRLVDLSRVLRQFILLMEKTSQETAPNAFTHLCKGLRDYYIFLGEMELGLAKPQR